MRGVLGKATAAEVRTAIGAINEPGVGVIAGDVSNANAWWVKFSGAVPLIIQGGIASEEQAFPIAFSMPFTALGTVDISAWNSSYNNYDDEFTLTKTSIKFRYFPHHFVAFGI